MKLYTSACLSITSSLPPFCADLNSWEMCAIWSEIVGRRWSKCCLAVDWNHTPEGTDRKNSLHDLITTLCLWATPNRGRPHRRCLPRGTAQASCPKRFVLVPCTLWVPQWGCTRWDTRCSNPEVTLAWSSSPDRHTLRCSRMQGWAITVKPQRLEAPSEISAWSVQSEVHIFRSDPTRCSSQSRQVHTKSPSCVNQYLRLKTPGRWTKSIYRSRTCPMHSLCSAVAAAWCSIAQHMQGPLQTLDLGDFGFHQQQDQQRLLEIPLKLLLNDST